MADETGLNPYYFPLEGGLVLDQPTFNMSPGMALELLNYEPDIRGGYRRIDGYLKWNPNVVPYTSSDTEPVLMSAYFAGTNSIIAARGEKVFRGGTTGNWTEIDNGRTGANKYTHFRYNLNGTEHIIWADGANHATKYDGTTVTDINTTGAPADPKYVIGYKNAFFFAGHSLNVEELIFTAPYTDNDFSVANGAGAIRVDSTITGLFPFRNELFIFCEERIFRLTGNTIADFQLQPVTRDVGCINGFTIQELAGEVLFLGKDGIRTVAATEKINDVNLGTITKPIQELFSNIPDISQFDSVVVPGKTQYRLFFTNTGLNIASKTRGVVAVLKEKGFEFSEIEGIQPSCTDFLTIQGESYVIHGGFDGYVYRQEQGNTFDGTSIIGRYRSPDMTMGDAGLRKNFQRVIINYAPTGVINSDLFIRYDYESPTVARPAAYPFDSSQIVALYGTSVYGTATYGGQSNPLVRQPIEGSGFSVAMRVVDNDTSSAYTLKGFQLEFTVGARR